MAQPSGSFVAGGGFAVIGMAGGSNAADPASRMNFGFNVQDNGNMKALKGHANLIFTAAGRRYQIKSNAIDSLGIALKTAAGAACSGPAGSTCLGLADFRSRANLTHITDPLTRRRSPAT